ncbi:hypothetical protein [Thalassospira sp. UBA1131]|uniref:hypothetical protein n=1 Tax=Thalassospira sp. UBA1131 TaxID=1947672 RepID=UPI0025F133AB|nr:hypothetical protein [Thalassospira sp. UBA1131]
MTQPTFDSPVAANLDVGAYAKPPEWIKGGSYCHSEDSKMAGRTSITIEIGGAVYQCADPNWFRHLIDQANAALTSAGYPPHVTAANDTEGDESKQEGSAA